MDNIRQEAKSVIDAINKGLKKLDISREEAEINIIKESYIF